MRELTGGELVEVYGSGGSNCGKNGSKKGGSKKGGSKKGGSKKGGSKKGSGGNHDYRYETCYE